MGLDAVAASADRMRVVKAGGIAKGKKGEISISLFNDARWSELKPPGLVIPRIGSLTDDHMLSIALAMESAGFKTVNSYASLTRVRNKLNCLVEMTRAGIPVLPFALVRLPFSLKSEINGLGGLPVLVKFIRGSQGVGVMKTTDSASASALVNAFNRLGFDVYLEKFVTDRRKSDLRFLLVKGEVIASMRKKVQRGEYRGNVHLGAEPIKYTASDAEIDLVVRVSKLFGLGLCGIDVLKTSRGLFVLEVNSSPGLVGISEATGRNIADEILRSFFPSRSKK